MNATSAPGVNGRASGFAITQRARTIAIAAALVLFASATTVTLLQQPWSKIYEEPTGLAWFLYPRDPPAQLAGVDAHLRTVWALPDNEHIWVGGDLGTIVYSKDGGENWTQRAIQPSPASGSTGSMGSTSSTGSRVATASARPSSSGTTGSGSSTKGTGSATSGGGSSTFGPGPGLDKIRAVIEVIPANPGSGASGSGGPAPTTAAASVEPSVIMAGKTVRATIRCFHFLLDPKSPIVPGDLNGPLKVGAAEILDDSSVVLNVTVDEKAAPGKYTLVLTGTRTDITEAPGNSSPAQQPTPKTPSPPAQQPTPKTSNPPPPTVSAVPVNITAVRFRDANYGKLIASSGFLYRTNNGGSDWFPDGPTSGEPRGCLTSDLKPIPAEPNVTAVQCRDNGTLLLMAGGIVSGGGDGRPDPGITVSRPSVTINGRVIGRPRSGGDANGEALAAGAVRAMGSGISRAGIPDLKPNIGYSAMFVSGGNAWLATTDSKLFSTSNFELSPGVMFGLAGSNRWEDTAAKNLPRINGLFFQEDAKRGWAAGSSGAILRTEDGGHSWTAMTQGGGAASGANYPSRPAPWYIVSLVLSALLFGIALLPYDVVKLPQPAIEVVAASDRPLEDGRDPDPLSFRPIARGLAYFIRNPHTSPPLTFAITGVWGTGKTSMMRLLRSELKDHGFRPVWFNAWHHQKEKYLLPSLLETIRQEAIPKLWHRGGIGFRFRLLRSRWQWWFAVLLLAFISTFAFTAAPALAPWLGAAKSAESGKGAEPGRPPATGDTTADFFRRFGPVGTALFSGFALFATLRKWLSAFGVEPAALLAASGSGTRVSDLEKQTSFRYRFSKEFQEVTKALHRLKMVIFIDDLDRCQQENSMDVLEAINFLGSSGDCFVVLGMAREVVEEYIAQSLRGVTNALNASRKEGEPPRTPKDLAAEYMQKLINIEVPVPKADAARMKELVESLARSAETPAAARTRGMLSWVSAFAQILIPVTVAGLLAWAGLAAGKRVNLHIDKPAAQAAATEVRPQTNTPPPLAGAVLPPLSSPAPSQSVTEAPPAKGEGPETGAFSPAKSGITWLHDWPALFVIAIMIWAVYRVATSRPDNEPDDSKEFTQAMEDVLPLVMKRAQTPRAVKRFVNRVRYLAMCRRQFQSDDRPLWSRLWKEKTPKPTPTGQNIPDAALVVLAALDYWKTSALDSDETLQSAFQEWKTLAEYDVSKIGLHRGSYRNLLTGITVN